MAPEKLPIYMDAHSTTQLAPEVVRAMEPYWMTHFGNAHQNLHYYNWIAQAAIEKAKKVFAQYTHAKPQEFYFTSSATESNYLALLGVQRELTSKNKKRILSLRIEHSSVHYALELMDSLGFVVEWIPVDSTGRVLLESLESLLASSHADHQGGGVGLVSVATANHEVGTLQDISTIASLCKKYGALFHTDAAQAWGRIALDLEKTPIDLMTLSAHKIHGPKGVGALYIRGQQSCFAFDFKLKLPTPQVPEIVGFARASELAYENLSEDKKNISQLRDDLLEGLKRNIPNVIVNGPLEQRLFNNLNVSFPNIDGAALFGGLQGVAVSNASSCLSGVQDYSQVLTELGHSKNLARSSVRFGLTRYNTTQEVQSTIEIVSKQVLHLMKMISEFESKMSYETINENHHKTT